MQSIPIFSLYLMQLKWKIPHDFFSLHRMLFRVECVNISGTIFWPDKCVYMSKLDAKILNETTTGWISVNSPLSHIHVYHLTNGRMLLSIDIETWMDNEPCRRHAEKMRVNASLILLIPIYVIQLFSYFGLKFCGCSTANRLHLSMESLVHSHFGLSRFVSWHWFIHFWNIWIFLIRSQFHYASINNRAKLFQNVIIIKHTKILSLRCFVCGLCS